MRCSDASRLRPAGSPSSRQPSSNENSFSRSRSAPIRCIANIAIRRTICSPIRSDCEYSAARQSPAPGPGRSRIGRYVTCRNPIGGSETAAVGEAELREPRARVHLERLADLRVDLVALAAARARPRTHVGARDAACTRSTAATSAVSQLGSARLGSRSRRNETVASWRRCAGATRSGSSIPRKAGSGRSVTHSTCGATSSSRWKRWSPFGSQSITRAPSRKPSYLSFWSSVVLPDPSAPTLRIVVLRSLSEPSRRLNLTGLPGAGQRVAEVEAAARADRMGRGRHHRRDLLGGERVVVAGDPRSLSRQVLQEQLKLLAERPVQADLAICTAAHLDALLERLLIRRTDGDRERRPQQRRPARCLQVAEQIARFLSRA